MIATTTGLTTALGIVGDFRQALLGVRVGSTRMEFSDVAKNAFTKHQRLVKLTTRWDIALMHSDAFETLSGITT